jgi:Ca2+-transporting ATPase
MEVVAAQASGLSDEEARRRFEQEGPNELPASKQRGVLHLLRDVASEPMFLLLVSCGAIYMVLGDVREALMLLGFVLVVMSIMNRHEFPRHSRAAGNTAFHIRPATSHC